MKKNILTLIGIATSILCSQAQNAAFTNRPEWKVTFHVADEDGKPVAGADAKVGYYIKPPPGQSSAMDTVQGKTDTNGLFVATGRSHFELTCSAKKDGYYPAVIFYELGLAYQYDAVKWNPTLKFELKKIKNPIPMHAKRVFFRLPILEKPVGYDLMEGDWVEPHGRGKTRDIIFTAHHQKKAFNDYEYKLMVSFPNPGDGIQDFQHPHSIGAGSKLKSPHMAPESGYKANLTRVNVSHPGQVAMSDFDEKRNYFLRVRTVLDEQGNVKSALYGKIYGDFTQFSYYLNPTANSRNIEFDPKQNLLTNLKSGEQVDEP